MSLTFYHPETDDLSKKINFFRCESLNLLTGILCEVLGYVAQILAFKAKKKCFFYDTRHFCPDDFFSYVFRGEA